MAGRTYRVGIIGTGNISKLHVEGLRCTGQLELAAGADVNAENLRAFGRTWGTSALYGDYREMLRRARPDIVCVCTWPDLHASIVLDAVASGTVRGILCEKPMAMNMGEARRMLQACDDAGVKLAVNHMRRFSPPYAQARELLDNGAIGKVQRVWAGVITQWEDPLVFTTHVTDMLRFFLGDVEWVMGQIGPIAPARAVQGGHRYAVPFVGYLRFRTGASGVLEFERNECRIHLMGETGDIVVWLAGGIPLDRSLSVRTPVHPAWYTPPLPPPRWLAANVWNAPFADALMDVVRAIESGDQPLNSGREGAAALEILLAVYESARMRGRVYLPLQTEDYPLERWEAPV